MTSAGEKSPLSPWPQLLFLSQVGAGFRVVGHAAGGPEEVTVGIGELDVVDLVVEYVVVELVVETVVLDVVVPFNVVVQGETRHLQSEVSLTSPKDRQLVVTERQRKLATSGETRREEKALWIHEIWALQLTYSGPEEVLRRWCRDF